MASTQELQAQRAALNLKMTAWRTSFIRENGREPTRGDKARQPPCDSTRARAQHQLTRRPPSHSVRRVKTRPTCTSETSSEGLKLPSHWPPAAPRRQLHIPAAPRRRRPRRPLRRRLPSSRARPASGARGHPQTPTPPSSTTTTRRRTSRPRSQSLQRRPPRSRPPRQTCRPPRLTSRTARSRGSATRWTRSYPSRRRTSRTAEALGSSLWTRRCQPIKQRRRPRPRQRQQQPVVFARPP